MFAQLVITLVTVWIIAEVLCRLILGLSVATAARELLGPTVEEPRAVTEAAGPAPAVPAAVPAVEPNATLRQLLSDRRRKLAETRARLELTMEAAEVAEQLARREAELAVTEGRLAEIEHRRSHSDRS